MLSAVGAIDPAFRSLGRDAAGPLPQLERQGNRIAHPLLQPLAKHDAVDHCIDGVRPPLGQLGHERQVDHLAVHPRPHQSLPGELGQGVAVCPSPEPGHIGQQQGPSSHLSGTDRLDNFLERLRDHRLAALWAVGHPSAGEQQPQKGGNLGQCGECATGTGARVPLPDGNHGRESRQAVAVGPGPVGDTQSHGWPKSSQATALSFGEHGVEGEGTFSTPADSRADYECLVGEFEGNRPQVMDTGPADRNACRQWAGISTRGHKPSAESRSSWRTPRRSISNSICSMGGREGNQ